jgi:urease accessory protein
MDALSLLRFHQIFDTSFPTGAFAHSGGIETYAKHGMTPDGLAELIRNNLALGYGRLDLAAAALAHRLHSLSEAMDELGWRVDASKVIEGPRRASLQMGRRVADVVSKLYSDVCLAMERPHYAVVAGAACAWLAIEERDAVLGLGQSMVLGSLAAATRCMRLGPVQAQAILSELQPNVLEAVDRVLADPEASMFTTTPGLDIHARLQATLQSRLFQS